MQSLGVDEIQQQRAQLLAKTRLPPSDVTPSVTPPTSLYSDPPKGTDDESDSAILGERSTSQGYKLLYGRLKPLIQEFDYLMRKLVITPSVEQRNDLFPLFIDGVRTGKILKFVFDVLKCKHLSPRKQRWLKDQMLRVSKKLVASEPPASPTFVSTSSEDIFRASSPLSLEKEEKKTTTTVNGDVTENSTKAGSVGKRSKRQKQRCFCRLHRSIVRVESVLAVSRKHSLHMHDLLRERAKQANSLIQALHEQLSAAIPPTPAVQTDPASKCQSTHYQQGRKDMARTIVNSLATSMFDFVSEIDCVRKIHEDMKGLCEPMSESIASFHNVIAKHKKVMERDAGALRKSIDEVKAIKQEVVDLRDEIKRDLDDVEKWAKDARTNRETTLNVRRHLENVFES